MCTGDPVRRAGNEFMFQMMAYQNIQTLNNYGIKKIVTACPHCFNIIKNEYPELGGNYEVIHHSVFLQQLIDEGKIRMKEGGSLKENALLTMIAVTWAGPMIYMKPPEKYWRYWIASWWK